jgi:glutaredoxin
MQLSIMENVTMYTTTNCPDCRRAKQFLKERGVMPREVNIDEDPDAEDLVIRVNDGARKVPTFEIGGRFFACSPFNPYMLAEEFKIPLSP